MTLTETMHLVFTSVGVLSMLLATGFAAAAFVTRFRLYSVRTILLYEPAHWIMQMRQFGNPRRRAAAGTRRVRDAGSETPTAA